MPRTTDCDAETSERLTDLIRLAANDSREAKERLYERVYDELRGVAQKLVRNRSSQDLQTTELVHEVVLRFEAQGAIRTFKNRRVFFSVAIRAMRQVLIDHYRRRKKLVDSPDRNAVPLEDVFVSVERQLGYDVERLEMALAKLELESPRQYAVVTHRFFGGLSIAETAEMFEVSQSTIERDWKLARAKLFRVMQGK